MQMSNFTNDDDCERPRFIEKRPATRADPWWKDN